MTENGTQDLGNLLVVDDTPHNLTFLIEYLEGVGFEVSAAEDGESALELLEFIEPDLILMDIQMPGIDGFETCERIKENPATRDIPVIFMTALADIEDKVRGFEVGAVDYVTKPLQNQELLARINTHLTIRRLQKQLQHANDALEQRVERRTTELATANESLKATNAANSRFVPKELLRLLDHDNIAEVRLGEHTQMDMTIMFADVRSFTSLSEQMTPRANFSFVNEYFGLVGPVVRRHMGFIDKFMGDAVMALFPTSAEDALNAAIEILKTLETYNANRMKKDRPPINIGIGMHTGRVMLGIVGEEERLEGTVISDAVNLAARLEGLTKLYQAHIVISEQVLFNLRDPNLYHIRFLDKAQVKGKSDPVSVFEVLEGESEEMMALKLETEPLFEEGLAHYRQEEFAEASVFFTKILRLNPQDEAARLYLKKAANYMIDGVPENWSPVTMLAKK